MHFNSGEHRIKDKIYKEYKSKRDTGSFLYLKIYTT